jgi:serine/threonine protein kinase
MEYNRINDINKTLYHEEEKNIISCRDKLFQTSVNNNTRETKTLSDPIKNTNMPNSCITPDLLPLIEKNNEETLETESFKDIPKYLTVGGSPLYRVIRKLGKGGFGQVYLGRQKGSHISSILNHSKHKEVALKFEHCTSKGCRNGQPPYEWSVYGQLYDICGIPKLYYKGKYKEYFVIVMELLGPSLWDIWRLQAQIISENTVACIAIEALRILENLHDKGYVHGDIKPENFLLGKTGAVEFKNLYLIDLGLTKRWKSTISNFHVEYDQRPGTFHGTLRYASVHAHLGRTLSRRDDLESLGYMILFLLKGGLPWQGLKGKNKEYQVCLKKVQTTPEILCQSSNKAFENFIKEVTSLEFDEKPKYEKYKSLFDPLYKSGQPNNIIKINLDYDVRSTQDKIYNTNFIPEVEILNKQVPKTIRMNRYVQQWITIYTAYKAMKQRYHCRVKNNHIVQHIEKGKENGLYISSISCFQELWAIVLDARVSLTAQKYLLSDQILPKNWIRERWEEGYQITTIASSSSGSSFVVMCKGSSYTEQAYNVSDIFPFEWINKKWRDGFFITSIASIRMKWVVIISRNTLFEKQCVELDFQYPSEGIHRRWNSGYRITACAATSEQFAFVLSRQLSQPIDERQETLRTSKFPEQHIKHKWRQNLYLTNAINNFK